MEVVVKVKRSGVGARVGVKSAVEVRVGVKLVGVGGEIGVGEGSVVGVPVQPDKIWVSYHASWSNGAGAVSRGSESKLSKLRVSFLQALAC